MRLQISTDSLAECDRVAFWNETVCQHLFNVTPDTLSESPRFVPGWMSMSQAVSP